MDEKIISNPEKNPFSIEVKNFDTDKTKWEIQKGVVNPPKDLPLPDELGELKFILEDILAGDSSQFDNEIIKNLNIDNIMAAIEWLARKDNLSETFKDNLLADGWRLNFKAKPPTPAEFLTEKYIGNQAESTYEWARDVFIDFMDPLKPYRTLVLTQHIASGKAQPYSSRIAIDEKNVIDFDFGFEKLTFDENSYILTKNGFDLAKNVRVDFPVSTNLLIMSIYDCRDIKEFEFAFKSENYDEIIKFFKNFNNDFLEENNIRCHTHHILPRSEGGTDDEENLVKLPIYFHIKAHYLRAKELELKKDLKNAYKNYKAVQCAIDRNIDIPKDYKQFLKELDIVVESLQRKQIYDKDTKWISKNGITKKVYKEDLEDFLKEGWEIKRDFRKSGDKVWVNNGIKNTYIPKEKLEDYLNNGYYKGMFITENMKKAIESGKFISKSTLNTKWIHKDNIRKCVKIEDLDNFLNNGWEIGSGVKTTGGPKGTPHKKQGMHWYTNGKESIQAIECPIGFKPGRIISEEQKEKLRKPKPKGTPHKKQGYHWYTNGEISMQALECPIGFKPGRIISEEQKEKLRKVKNENN